MNSNFRSYFEKVEDPRSLRNQRHPFIMLIGRTLLALLSGIDSFSGIAEFVEVPKENLEKYFEFPCGVPSHDTYQRLWDAINPAQFVEAFMIFSGSLSDIHGAGTVLSIDRKTIRNSGSDKALHIVSAWCEANQLMLAQKKVFGTSFCYFSIAKN